MMDFLSGLRIKTKLMLMITIPLVAMLYFSINILLEQNQQQEEMEKLGELSVLVGNLSRLIHETQKERGASAGFTGSKGKKFAEMLPKQRKVTDQRITELKSGLSSLNPDRYGKRFAKQLAAFLADIEQLAATRDQVSRLALPLPKVVGWYTAMNAKLLAVVENMPHVVSDAELVAKITAYVNYLQSKERTGIERAVLSATFGGDRFAPGMYKKFIELVAAQNNFIHVFNAMASASDKKIYLTMMKHESVAQVETMRKTAFEKAQSGGFGIDAEQWFKTMTLKINQLKQVDDQLSEGIADRSAELLEGATLLFRFYLLLVVVLFGLTVWMARRVSGAIRESVLDIGQVVQVVVDEGKLSTRVEVRSKDGIGEIGQNINRLLDKIQLSIGEANTVVTDIAHGVFSSRMSVALNGDLQVLKEGVNNSADSVERTMSTLKEVMDAIANGRFDYRLEGVEMEGEFRDSLLNAMEGMEVILTDINQVMGAVAEGRFDARVTEEARGDMDTLKQNLNGSLEKLGDALKETVQVANKMGEGDLTVSVEGNYKGALGVLKDSINTTRANFEQIVGKVRSVAHLVHSGADEISRGSLDLSSRTSEQAASLEQTAASMEEMASTVNMNADNVAQANQLAAESLQRAKEGGEVVANAEQAMEGINDSSSKIAEIISLIDGIAFQTNLLALNAAVEAARAGDHG
ncbi:MAG: HAMP domain-containing protein, partial [Gammaproteobacteria bacterium]|nr:HAMP domain-containing protein [Gammaproteobacteria bacterium]